MGLDIGGAMAALRDGKMVRRGGWPAGLNIDHLYLVDNSRFVVNRPPLAPVFEGEEVRYRCHIDAFWRVPADQVAGGEIHAHVWTPTHDDLLANDWYVVGALNAAESTQSAG